MQVQQIPTEPASTTGHRYRGEHAHLPACEIARYKLMQQKRYRRELASGGVEVHSRRAT